MTVERFQPAVCEFHKRKAATVFQPLHVHIGTRRI